MTDRAFEVDGIRYLHPWSSVGVQLPGVASARDAMELHDEHTCLPDTESCTFDRGANYVDTWALERKLPSFTTLGMYNWRPGDVVARFGGAR